MIRNRATALGILTVLAVVLIPLSVWAALFVSLAVNLIVLFTDEDEGQYDARRRNRR